MALILRSGNICSFIDGAREPEKPTLITAGEMGLDLGKDLPVVRSGRLCDTPPWRFQEELDQFPSAIESFVGQQEGGGAEFFPTPTCPYSFSHALPRSH